MILPERGEKKELPGDTSEFASGRVDISYLFIYCVKKESIAKMCSKEGGPKGATDPFASCASLTAPLDPFRP